MNISVALCTYNGERYIAGQLESILTQTTPVTEIIICDDGSKDETVNTIKSFQQNYPEIIKLHINHDNLGVVKNFEQALGLCTGDLIFLSDQDDIWMKNKVEECKQYLVKNNSLLGCFTDALLIDENNTSKNKNLWASILFDAATEDDELFNFLVSFRNVVTGACLVLKREALMAILPIPKIGKMLHDEWIALKLSAKNQLGKINKPVIQYRVHASQQTGLPLENYNENYFKIRMAIFKNDFTQYPLYHYFHWMRRLKDVYWLKNYFQIPDDLVRNMEAFRNTSLKTYFKTKPLLQKKIALIKWYVKGNKDITIRDIILI